MSEEEIIEKMDKDLRFLEGFIDDSTTSIIVDIQLIKDFRKLLDLYNKQKNQIASQKKQIKLMQSCDLAKEIRNLQEEIEELKKPKFIMNAETGEVTKIHNDYISKDKIRNKIKELEKEKEKYKGDKGLIYSQVGFIQSGINVLNKLLEE